MNSIIVKYLWENRESVEKSEGREECVYRKRNSPKGPECIVRVAKAH